MKLWKLITKHPLRFCGYGSLAAGLLFAVSLNFTTLADPENRHPLFNQWLLLITAGLFATGVFAFIVGVVVDAIRNFWRKFLKRLGWCVLWLVTLVTLLVVFENWRGRRAWAQFVTELKAVGDDPNYSAVVPPPIPDAENFAMAPIFRGILDLYHQTNRLTFEETGHGIHVLRTKEDFGFRETNAYGRLQNMKVVGTKTPNSNGGWRSGRFMDLVAWQEHYRSDTDFPATPEPQSPGADIMYALGKLDPDLAMLREAALRPKSRFPVHYDDLYMALLPHLIPLKKLTLFPQMRAVAELAENKVDDAAMDTLLALRVVNALEAEPFLISHLVRMAQLEITITPLWEGLARHQWTEPHLAAFEARLAELDFLSDGLRALRGERNGALAGLDMMRDAPEQYEMIAMMENESGGSGWSGLRFMPAAFTDQSKVVIGRMFQDYRRSVDLKARRFDPEITIRTEERLEQLKIHAWRKPYHILGALLMPALTKSAEKFARAQTTVDLARVAIALERHRLKHGALPETLEAIDPALRPAGGLPHDVISGGPLRYARTADGRFHLYAVGWNGTDEGGSIVWKNTEKTQIDFTQGDWVWPQPAR